MLSLCQGQQNLECLVSQPSSCLADAKRLIAPLFDARDCWRTHVQDSPYFSLLDTLCKHVFAHVKPRLFFTHCFRYVRLGDAGSCLLVCCLGDISWCSPYHIRTVYPRSIQSTGSRRPFRNFDVFSLISHKWQVSLAWRSTAVSKYMYLDHISLLKLNISLSLRSHRWLSC